MMNPNNIVGDRTDPGTNDDDRQPIYQRIENGQAQVPPEIQQQTAAAMNDQEKNNTPQDDRDIMMHQMMGQQQQTAPQHIGDDTAHPVSNQQQPPMANEHHQHGNDVSRPTLDHEGQSDVPREQVESQQQPPPQLLLEEIAFNERMTSFGMQPLSFSLDGNEQKLAHSLIYFAQCCLFRNFQPTTDNLYYIILLFNKYSFTKVYSQSKITLDDYRQVCFNCLALEIFVTFKFIVTS